MATQTAQGRQRGQPESVRRAVLRLQRGVQRLLEAELRAYTGGDTPALERYQREYMREFRRHHTLASFGELMQAILETDLFFVGDYHTLRQSQDLARRLLERAAADKRPLVLALEMVLGEHQRHLDAYMRGEIDDAAFLQRIQYQRTWNFDWENYRPLFATARRLGVTVVGINHPGRTPKRSLRERDECIASSLVEALLERPGARFMVLIGDMHLAASHLPRALEVRLRSRHLDSRRLVVFQNADTLYWSLAERGQGLEPQVVRLGADRFCVIEVPPHVKLQSYLSWERALERFGEDTGASEDLVLEQSTMGLFEALLRQLSRFFAVPPVHGGCEIFTSLDEEFFAAIEAGELDEGRRREIQLLAFGNRSCFVHELDLIYLPYFSVNHASETAMRVLLARLVGPPEPTADPYEAFYARAWDGAIGFLGSKLVNPHRRATGEQEFRRFLRTASRHLHEPRLAFRKLVARFVVQHKEHEQARLAGRRGRLQQIYEQEPEIGLEVTWALGSMLGDALAESLLSGALSPEGLRALLLRAPRRSASERYFALLRALET